MMRPMPCCRIPPLSTQMRVGTPLTRRTAYVRHGTTGYILGAQVLTGLSVSAENRWKRSVYIYNIYIYIHSRPFNQMPPDKGPQIAAENELWPRGVFTNDGM